MRAAGFFAAAFGFAARLAFGAAFGFVVAFAARFALGAAFGFGAAFALGAAFAFGAAATFGAAFTFLFAFAGAFSVFFGAAFRFVLAFAFPLDRLPDIAALAAAFALRTAADPAAPFMPLYIASTISALSMPADIRILFFFARSRRPDFVILSSSDRVMAVPLSVVDQFNKRTGSA
jgi:hypothetical protein